MDVKKIQIYVPCHFPAEVYQDDVYIPVHVGRAISTCADRMKDMLGDNTGDNISDRNASFCEMTLQYWAWKNVHDVEYIGFCQYRRYFEKKFTAQMVDGLFADGTDVILAGPQFRNHNRYNYLKTFVCEEDIAIMLHVIEKMCPEYMPTISAYAQGFTDYPFNMMVCRKTLFDAYAAWIFPILFACEQHCRPQPYSRGRRLIGYLSEFLMPAYFMHNACKIQPMRYWYCWKDDVYIRRIGWDDGVAIRGIGWKYKRTWPDKIRQMLCENILYACERHRMLEIDPAVEKGLRQDGIIEKL